MQMKEVYKSKERVYRALAMTDNDEQQHSVIVEESDICFLLTNKIPHEEIAQFIHNELFKLRQEIKLYSYAFPEFYTSLLPISHEVEKQLSLQSPIIKEMLEASEIIGVGPFAAVAGSISEHLAKKVSAYLCDKRLSPDCIIENGGDIYIISEKERTIALLDKPKEGIKIGLSIKPTQGLSICASSATIGHSMSFGNADLVAVLADKGALADCMATATANMIKSSNDFEAVLNFYTSKKDKGLQGIFCSCDDKMLAYGNTQLVAL